MGTKWTPERRKKYLHTIKAKARKANGNGHGIPVQALKEARVKHLAAAARITRALALIQEV